MTNFFDALTKRLGHTGNAYVDRQARTLFCSRTKFNSLNKPKYLEINLDNTPKRRYSDLWHFSLGLMRKKRSSIKTLPLITAEAEV